MSEVKDISLAPSPGVRTALAADRSGVLGTLAAFAWFLPLIRARYREQVAFNRVARVDGGGADVHADRPETEGARP